MTLAQTAAEAFERYQAFLQSDSLIQKTWHDQAQDGRQLACAIGVLGDEVSSPRDCPAQIMPRWLANHVVWLFDGQPFDEAKAWGLKFYAEIKRLNGQVPFSVVYDWHANIIAPLNIEIAERLKLDPSLPRAVSELHAKALAGDVAPRTAWFEALRPSLHQAYLFRYKAYAYADAYANAYADAYAYAYADANANADADAYAYAKNLKRMADGLIECLARVSA